MKQQIEEAKRYLEALTGNADTPCTWQTLPDNGGGQPLCNIIHGPIDKVSGRLIALNDKGAGIFVTVNQTDLEGREAKNVTALRSLFVDCDNGSFGKTELQPNIVVKAKRGEHGYWLLDADEPLNDFRRAQKLLAKALGTDEMICDLPRVMRVPGFFHCKGDPYLVKLCRADGNRKHGIGEILEFFNLSLEDEVEEPEGPRIDLSDLLGKIDKGKLAAACRKYLSKMSFATEGAGGDNATYGAAMLGGDFGLTFEEYWPLFCEWNKGCSPPWSDNELRKKLTHAYKYRKRPLGIKLAGWAENKGEAIKKRAFITRGRRDTEANLAGAFVDTLLSKGPAVSTGSSVYTYDHECGFWSELDMSQCVEIIRGFDGATVLSSGSPIELKMSWNKAQGIYKFALNNLRILDRDYFLTRRPGVAFRNGFVHVDKNGVYFEGNAPENRARNGMAFDYDGDASFDVWRGLLSRLFDCDSDCEEKHFFLQEFIGACLCGMATSFDRCVVLVGGGGNGKSTFQEVITDNLFPQESVGRVTPQNWAIDHYLHGLRDKLINVVPEMPRERILASDVFKAVVTGDVVQSRSLYHTAHNMRPIAGHLFACNELPGTGDYTSAFWERFVVIEFNRVFRGKAGWKSRTELLAELVSEQAGIMCWALHGAVRLLRRREYTIPASNAGAKQDWQQDVDNVAGWVNEKTEPFEGGRVGIQSAYDNYREWCKDCGRQPVGKNTFCKRVGRAGVEADRNTRQRYYKINLKESW